MKLFLSYLKSRRRVMAALFVAAALVVCGGTVDEAMKNDIAVAERLRSTATTLDGILTVKGQGREDGGKKGA